MQKKYDKSPTKLISSEVSQTFSSDKDEKSAYIAYPQIFVSIKMNL